MEEKERRQDTESLPRYYWPGERPERVQLWPCTHLTLKTQPLSWQAQLGQHNKCACSLLSTPPALRLCWEWTFSPPCSCVYRGKRISTLPSRGKDTINFVLLLHYLLRVGGGHTNQRIWWWDWAYLTQSLSLPFWDALLQRCSYHFSSICCKLQVCSCCRDSRLHVQASDMMDKPFKRRILASPFWHKSKAIFMSPISYFLIHLKFSSTSCNDRCGEGTIITPPSVMDQLGWHSIC